MTILDPSMTIAPTYFNDYVMTKFKKMNMKQF